MRPIALSFLLLILAPLAAFAQPAQVLPASPNAADRLTLQLTSNIRCPTGAPWGLKMEGQVITVEVVPSCFLACAPYTGRVAIGRHPAGSYG